MLEQEFGLSFCRVNPAKFLCDETYARLEAVRTEAESGRAGAGAEHRRADEGRTAGRGCPMNGSANPATGTVGA